jgi:hypothetical protein
MAGPSPCLDQFGLGPRNATFRAVEPGAPERSGAARRSRRSRPPRGPLVKQILAWTLGAGGYTALLVASHGSPHADDLRGLAIAWLMIFGALNAHLILSRR